MILVPSLFTVKTILMIAFILKFETMSGKFWSSLGLVLVKVSIVTILDKWDQDMSFKFQSSLLTVSIFKILHN